MECCLQINKKSSWSADEKIFVSPVVSKVFKVTYFSDKLWSLFFKFRTNELLEANSSYTERLLSGLLMESLSLTWRTRRNCSIITPS